jgi:hypothetical protein
MSRRAPSSGAVGWITFAGFVMIISGGFSILQGLGMLINSDQFPNSDSVFSQNATTWGWVQLLVGAVVLLAGFGVFSGNVLARTVGVIGATISALASFVAIGLYPVWGICIIAVDIAVIWALTAHGRDVQRMREMSEMSETG